MTANELTEAREAANKLLPLPQPAKYLLYWNVRVLVPILLTVLVLRGTGRAKAVGATVLILATSLTLEKSLPFFALVACGFAVAIYRRASIVSRPVIMGCLLGIGVAVALVTGTKLREMEATLLRAANTDSPTLLPGAGVRDATAGGILWTIASYPVEFVSHRILSSPAGVAYAWFEYFPDVHGGFLYGRAWLPSERSRTDFKHPANLVGVYAYHRRDPEHYLATAHAYGAFHADAWANFGYAGVLIASVSVAAVLFLAEIAMRVAVTPLLAGASGAGLTILLVTLPAGGLQAALVPQGLVVCLAIVVVELLRQRISGPRGAASGRPQA